MIPENCISKKFTRSPARKFAFAFIKDWFKIGKAKKLHDPFTVAVALMPDNAISKQVKFEIDNDGKCKGTKIDSGKRFATIGGTPSSLDWFFEIFFWRVQRNLSLKIKNYSMKP